MDFKGNKVETKVCQNYRFIPDHTFNGTAYEYFSESKELICFDRVKDEFISIDLQTGKVTKILILPRKYSNLHCYSENGNYLISFTDRSESKELNKMFIYYPKLESVRFDLLDLNKERYLGEFDSLIFYIDDTGSLCFYNKNNHKNEIVYGVHFDNGRICNISEGRYLTFCDHNKIAIFDCLDRKVLINIINNNY